MVNEETFKLIDFISNKVIVIVCILKITHF